MECIDFDLDYKINSCNVYMSVREDKKKNLSCQEIGLKFKEETSEMLRLEHGSVWCWNLDAPGNRSETPGKFWNVVLEKDGEDQLDLSCDKWRIVTYSQWAEEYLAWNKETEG